MLSDQPVPTRSLAPLPVAPPAAAPPADALRVSALPAGWTAAASRLLWAVFLLIALEALFSVPAVSWALAVPGRARLGWAVGLAIALAAGGLLWAGRRWIAGRVAAAGDALARIPGRWWLAAVIAFGVLLRLGWLLLFPAPFVSDGRSYYQLAVRLAEGLTYQTPQGEWAVWPPGYPFLLWAHFQVLGITPQAVIVSNLLLFVAMTLVVYALARRFSEGTARLSVLILALWPNLVMLSGVPNKERVISFLLPLILLLYLKAGERRAGVDLALRFGAGLVLGYATLTQPGVMLLAGVFLIYEILLRTPVFQTGVRFGLLLAGMALVILPWTLRNERVLGEPVLVSTNGGSVFYRANNPRATGGFMPEGERPINHYDELTRDRLGYAWGKQWIRENPGQFLALAFKKQLIFLGDDATGAYETLKRGLKRHDTFYALAKLGSNVWWWGIWALVLAALLAHGGDSWHRRADVVLFLLTVLYFWAIDSVFESGARHHLPLLGLLAILAVAGPRAAPRPRESPAEP